MRYCSHSIELYLHCAGSTVKRYPTPAAWCWRAPAMQWGDCEQIPHVCCSALEQQLCSAGVTVRRYLTSKAEKPQQDSRHLSTGCMALEWQLHTTRVTLTRYPTMRYSNGKGEAPARW